MDGSFCSDVVSPSVVPSNNWVSSRRMILPLRVLGTSGTTTTSRGLAIGPIAFATWLRRPAADVAPEIPVFQRTTNATIACPVLGSVTGQTPASTTAGCETERRLDLDRGEQVPGDVEGVVRPPEDPDVAVVVIPGAVAGEEPALRRVLLQYELK